MGPPTTIKRASAQQARDSIRDLATRRVDQLAWDDGLFGAIAAPADAQGRLGDDAVELVPMPGRLLDAHARRLNEGER